MKKVFHQVDSFDEKCCNKLGLSADILMENASGGMRDYIYKYFNLNSKVLIVCGFGNNGADGITLARQINGDYNVSLYLLDKNVSNISKIQLDRAKNVGVNIVNVLQNDNDVVVDCIFGSGLNREISLDIEKIIKKLNSFDGYKISCDIPSGLYPQNIQCKMTQKEVFVADTVITMGGLKTSLFSDIAKDFYKELLIVNLGVSQEKYQDNTNIYLLEKEDLILPLRDKQNTHKGSYGHCVAINYKNSNSKLGASVIALKSATTMGSGLCTLVGDCEFLNDYEIMTNKNIPQNTTSLFMGMGLGDIEKEKLNHIKNFVFDKQIPCLLDADMFYKKDILDFLCYQNTVLTPHPKEFISLLYITGIADISLDDLSNNRFFYTQKFSDKYPKITLLLKGANTLIASEGNIYINPLGTPALSKGGSGDVLSGIISSYLAQGYTTKQSAIYGSLAHSIASTNYKHNNYSLSPLKLIRQLAKL